MLHLVGKLLNNYENLLAYLLLKLIIITQFWFIKRMCYYILENVLNYASSYLYFYVNISLTYNFNSSP